MIPLHLAVATTAAKTPAAKTSEAPQPDDIVAILRDVHALDSRPDSGLGGLGFGTVASFGENAFVVCEAPAASAGPVSSAAGPIPVVAAARYNRGKAVALGEPSLLDAECLARADNARFLQNLVNWTAAAGKPDVAVVELPAVRATLKASGFEVLALTIPTLLERIEAPDFDVIVLQTGPLDGKPGERLVQFLTAFLKRGGGAILLSHGANWRANRTEKTLAEHGGNRLMSFFGVAWTDTLARIATDSLKTDAMDGVSRDAADSLKALRALEKHASGVSPLAEPDFSQALRMVTLAATATVPEESKFLPQVAEFVKRAPAPERPAPAPENANAMPGATAPAGTPEFSVSLAEPVARLKIALESQSLRARSLERLAAHPAAAIFPGTASSLARPRRIVTIDPANPVSPIGLYAAPGETIQIQVPADALRAGLFVRVGAHSETLWDEPLWNRFPELLVARRPLSQPLVKIGTAFGGPILIEGGTARQPVELIFEGAVSVPNAVARTPLTFAATRESVAPFSELSGTRFLAHLPSETLRVAEGARPGVADESARLWEAVAGRADTFFGPTRQSLWLVVDRQSGLPHTARVDTLAPIVVPESLAPALVDPDAIRSGSRGISDILAVLGERRAASLPPLGAPSVLTKLFAEMVLSPGDPRKLTSPERDRIRRHLSAGAPRSALTDDPALGILLMKQLRAEELLPDVIRRMPAVLAALPTDLSPSERADCAWAIALSQSSGKNLIPQLRAWSFALPERALPAELLALPRFVDRE